MPDRVNWDRVAQARRRNGDRMVWKPYGLPEVIDPTASAFVPGVEVAPRWPIPETVIVSTAITGAFFSRSANPHQPMTTQEVTAAARSALDAGATTVHIHVRDGNGYNTLDPTLFADTILPLKRDYPGLAVDGCLVAALDGEWQAMTDVLRSGLLDISPVNTTAVYTGDALFAKPVHMIIEKAARIQETGGKVQIAVYADADIDNARRYLINSELLTKPYYWIVLPALPGCSPMHNPAQMVDGLQRMVRAIYDIDPTSQIMVCAAGRASSYLTTLALLLGLHIRIGMEDSVWLWPHRDDIIESNEQVTRMAVSLVDLLGRRVATSAEYRTILGIDTRERHHA